MLMKEELMVCCLLTLASATPPKVLPWMQLMNIRDKSSHNVIKFDSLEAIEGEWKTFKVDYGKTYDATEEIIRKRIFANNLKKIKTHNDLYSKGLKTFTLGVNEFADLELSEFLKRMTCYSFRNFSKHFEGSNVMSPMIGLEVPKQVDWRDKGYVTPVKNQGQCGSCWAFSATGALEGQNFRKRGRLISLSEQNLVDCSTSYGNKGCNGGWMDNAFKYVKYNGGIDTESSYPYEAKDGKCRYNPATTGSICTGFVDILKGSEPSLQTAIATVGPVSVAIDAGHSSFQLYKSGVYDEPKCSSISLNHAVLAVGYGTTSSKEDYWIIKNSWGIGWGMQGYVWMSRNKNNQCGIANYASYPLV